MSMIAAMITLTGLVQPALAETPILLGLRAVGEVWQDPNIATVYGGGRVAGSAVISWRPHNVWSIDAEAAMMRVGEDIGPSISLTPMSLSLCARRGSERTEVFAGGGVSIVPFLDKGESTISGTKLGADVKIGVRIATALVQPTLYPVSTVQGVDLEAFLGRRQHFANGVEDRLDLSAWRVGIGLVARI